MFQLGGTPAQTLAQLEEAIKRHQLQIPESTMRTIVGLLKMAHDLQLPPTCFTANCTVDFQGPTYVRFYIDGYVGGG